MRRPVLSLLLRASALVFVAACLFFSPVAEASFLSFSYQDDVGEGDSSIDLTAMSFRFDDTTGWYEITFVASRTEPFFGAFRLDVNLANETLGEASFRSRGGFRDVFNDFEIAPHRADCNFRGSCRNARKRTLVLTGTNRNLTAWRAGDRILAHGPATGLATGVRDLSIPPASLAASSDLLPSVAAVVPEPSAGLLLGIGLAAYSAASRRSRP